MIRHPTSTKPKRIVKRIIGLPGDIVKVDDAHFEDVYVKVPVDHCWLEGDNPVR